MNQITITFLECDPKPSKGYNVKWRVMGSGDPYTDAGNFFTTPAVFTDNVNPPGTIYEGIITAEGRDISCNSVGWNTLTEESPSGSSGGGFDNSSCGTTISENTASLSYVILPAYTLHVDLATHVDLAYNVTGRPNRLTLYDNGVFSTTTGWKGIAPYGGPWGISLNTALTGFISFNPIAGHVYTLVVEVGPAGPAPYDVSDSFTVDVICS